MDDQLTSVSPIRHPDLIIPRLYLCDLYTAQDPVVAASLGITHIVSVLDFVPTFPNEMQHIEKMHVRLSDNFREKITPHLEHTTAFIREALESDPENKVLVRGTIERGYVTRMAANPCHATQVHCFMGISRSATVVCAYLIAEEGLTTGPAAINFVREKRSVVCPNLGFRHQLDEYAVKLHGGTKEETEVQTRLSEVQKNFRVLGTRMLRVMNKKEVDSVAS